MKIVVATTSYYPLDSESSRVRAELALELMKKTKSKGYELVIADNGSSPEFLSKLKENDLEYVLQTKPGFGNGKRLAIEEATKTGDRWESIFLLVIDAIRDGRKIISVEVDYIHPQSQTENEEGNLDFDIKRLDQLYSLSKAVDSYWNR